MKNFKIILTLMLASTVLFTHAQDLIKDTRNEVQHSAAKKELNPNNIAKKVKETFKNRGYMTSKVFELQKNQKQLVAKNSTAVEDAVYLNLNKVEIAKIVETSPNSLKLQIPVTENSSISLALIKNDFTAKGFEITTSAGEKFKIDNNALFYKGIVNNDPTSIAAISIFDGDINGIISDKNGNYNLGSLKNDKNRSILYNSKYAKVDKEFSCGGELLDDYYENEQFKANKTGVSAKKTENIACDSNDCVGVYFEVAEDLYHKLGSVKAVVQYVTAVFNSASIVFENEQADNGTSRAMKICLSSMFIWTEEDIYHGRRGARLGQFQKQLYDYDFPGAIAMVLSYIPGDSGGFAYTGPFRNPTTGIFDADPATGMFKPGICHDHIIPPGVAGNGSASGPIGSVTFNIWYETYPDFSRDVDLIAHETGHIFGSPHTHACAWKVGGQSFKSIDNCGPGENNGEKFYEYTPNSGAAAIEHNCTFDGTLQGANDPSLMSYCGNVPLTEGFGEQPGELMYNNYVYGVANGCFPVQNRDNVFAEFTFLNPLVSQTNCSNERISVFRDGSNSFVYVETDDFTRLYNNTGGVLCEEGTNINCICEYNLYEIDDYWACCGVDADPVDTQVLQNCECENDDSIFDTYGFISINPNSCNGESVTVYARYEQDPADPDRSIQVYYIYVKNGNQNTLFREDGIAVCASANDACINEFNYNLTEINEQLKWRCCNGLENQLWGCTDAAACNYQPQADTNDGSCVYTSCNTNVCQGATSTYPWLNDFIQPGTCTEIFSYFRDGFNYVYLKYNNQGFVYSDQYSSGSAFGSGDSGNFSVVTGNGLGNIEEYWTCGCASPPAQILGCTDGAACNYNPQANTDDSSCEYQSCASSCEDAYQAYPWLNGTIPANTCVEIYDYLAIGDYWHYIYVTYNGVGKLYLNINNSGSLYYTDNGDGYALTQYSLTNLVDQWSCGCAGNPTQILGCTDATACNYNSSATADDGSCEYQSCASSCDDAYQAYPWLNGTIPANTCVEIYDYLAIGDYWHYIYVTYNGVGKLYLNINNNGSLYYTDNGDGYALTQYSLTNLVDQWSCGCTGNPTQILGCTDATACNYNSQATADDGSCEYQSCASSCEDAYQAYPWLNGTIPANTCVQVYDYLANGDYWHYIYVTYDGVGKLYLNINNNGSLYYTDNGDGYALTQYSLTNLVDQWSCGCGQFKIGDDLNQNAFLILPNPSDGQFNIILSKNIKEDARVEIYSIEGKQMKTIKLNETIQQRINVSDFSSGLYLIKVVSDSYSSTQRFTIR